MAEYKNIYVEKKGKVAVVTINRPEKLNALNIQTMDEINNVIAELNEDITVSAIIFTGKGDKAFVAGADIAELNMLDENTGKGFALKGQAVFNNIENSGKPVIAAVNGYALGGGCELALACHIRLASENAIFGQPEINLGAIPGYGGTQRLTRLINPGRALEYILTGDMINAQEALRTGLVNNVFSRDELLNKAIELAEKIASKAPVAVKLAVKAVNMANETLQAGGLEQEAGLFALCCSTEDFKEGTAAFLQKRKAEFKGK
jgi:enoyl-CoA hydratase